MDALKCNHPALAYKAGTMLTHCVSKHEEHRDALTAQMESVIEPLVAHLASEHLQLVHNATALLGQCLMTSSEFRQAFASSSAGANQLVTAMGSTEPTVVVGATWAVRHFFSDPKCEVGHELLDLAHASLVPLLGHKDSRIQKHASKLNTLVHQRREYLKATSQQRPEAESEAEQVAPSPRSSSAVAALTSIRGTTGADERRVSAISVLASLTAQLDDRGEEESRGDIESSPSSSPHSSPEASPVRSPEVSSSPSSTSSLKKLSVNSPRGHSRLSPWKKHSSHVAPWKKSMANRFTIKSR